MHTTSEEIVDAFQVFDVAVSGAAILDQLMELSQLFNLDGDALVNEWLAYQSKNNQCELNIHHLELFHSQLTSTYSKKKAKGSANLNISSNAVYDQNNISQIFTRQPDAAMDILEEYCTPANIKKLKNVQERYSRLPATENTSVIFSPSSKSPARSQSVKYASRTNAGETVDQLREGETSSKEIWVKPASRTLKQIQCCQNHARIQKTNKYMFQKIVDTCDVLNDVIESTAEELQNHHQIQSFAPCAAPSQSPCVTVGRIASETGKKLHPSSLLLEGDRLHSFGRSVSLDIESLPEYSLFPGQVVALQGTNPTGKKFVATDLYSLPCKPGKVEIGDGATSGDSVDDFINILVAAGPFSTSDSLSYQPLEDFLTIVQSSKPDVTILIGPLIDAGHTDIEKDKVEQSFADLTNSWIESITLSLDGITSLVFIPSQRDVFHHPVYPQPPYNVHTKSKSAHFLSDPCTFDVGSCRLGVTSTDVLFHLGAEEIFRSASGSADRLARLTRHLLAQRRYYPLYPAHESLSVDWMNAEYTANMPSDFAPDILILPSDLRCFAKCVTGHACVNPGRLAKGESGGTYARIRVARDGKGKIPVVAEVVRI